MLKKKCIRYLRFSDDDQSMGSTERQDLITSNWSINNNVDVINTFKDEGFSARTANRPDLKKLFSFIAENKHIDYLVVSELTRFSRELGEAVSMVQEIQKKYNIKIVSAGRSAIYDVNDSTSYFVMALEFLLGNTENIKRMSDINGGIYTAGKVEKRYAAGLPPFGYKKIFIKELADRKHPKGKPGIAPDETTAAIVRFIFDCFVNNMPVYLIHREAKKLGFKHNAKTAVQTILGNRIYTGMLHVKAYKEFPEEWVQGIHEPLIDLTTFEAAQLKLKPGKPVQIIDDKFPLRGVLKCWCTKPLTGASSTGRHGVKYDYYKCNISSAHNNIATKKAHQQLAEIWKYLSLPQITIAAVKETSEIKLQEIIQQNTTLKQSKTQKLSQLQKQLESIEEKYISNTLQPDSYYRWHQKLTVEINQLKQQVQHLGREQEELYFLLQTELEKLTNLNYIYHEATTVQKQQLIRIVFDSRLYYSAGSYRTAYLMPLLRHNSLILNHKQLLIIEETKSFAGKARGSGEPHTPIEPLFALLTLFRSVKVAG
jgi:site-specific DNA recombinase